MIDLKGFQILKTMGEEQVGEVAHLNLVWSASTTCHSRGGSTRISVEFGTADVVVGGKAESDFRNYNGLSWWQESFTTSNSPCQCAVQDDAVILVTTYSTV